jgi:hypothetical protein
MVLNLEHRSAHFPKSLRYLALMQQSHRPTSQADVQDATVCINPRNRTLKIKYKWLSRRSLSFE